MRDKQAFTLVEIMIVLIIIGVMAALAVPRFGTTVEITRVSEGTQILTALWTAQRKFAIDEIHNLAGGYASNIANLDTRIPASPNFTVTVSNNPFALARVHRITGEYDLVIAENGTITCAETVAGLCQRLGF